MVRLSSKRIRKLWEDPNFAESFSGVTTFRNALEEKYNFPISITKLRDILRESPQFLDSVRRIKKFKRRRLQLTGNLLLWQMDIAIFNEYQGYKYALVVIGNEYA